MNDEGLRYSWITTAAEGYAQLVEELDHFQNSIYPPESNHLDSLQVLAGANVRIMGAYANTQLVGTCAAKKMQGYVELKRLYVIPAMRGQKIALHLIQKIEEQLVLDGVVCVKAETGIYQNEAISLYKKLGYNAVGPFGQYQQNPFNLFFSKSLTAL